MAAPTTNGHADDGKIDYTKYISRSALKWKPSGIRGLFPLESIPGMVSFLAGKPNPTTFPIESISLSLKSITSSSTSSTAKALPETLTIQGADLEEALQYSATAGLPRLVKWMVELQKQVHSRGDPKEEGWSCSVGSGSQDLLVKAFAVLCNPGDSVLIETPAYSGTLGLLRPLDLNQVEVDVDAEGLSDTKLASILDNWYSDPATKNHSFPRVLYTIPTGSNPTGYTAPLHRRLAILAIAKRHKLLIIEDDPYFHIHFDRSTRPASYWELEAEGKQGKELEGKGRVVRLDSFSKILSSGMRLGLCVGPAPIMEVIDLITANTNLQPNSTTQAIFLALFSHWGLARFLSHCDGVAHFYQQKRDLFERAVRKHLAPPGGVKLAEWETPGAGMFLWLKLSIAPADSDDPGDSSHLISTKALAQGVLAVPGFAFMPSEKRNPYVRCSYSLATEEQADEGLRRLALVIKEERREAGLKS